MSFHNFLVTVLAGGESLKCLLVTVCDFNGNLILFLGLLIKFQLFSVFGRKCKLLTHFRSARMRLADNLVSQ